MAGAAPVPMPPLSLSSGPALSSADGGWTGFGNVYFNSDQGNQWAPWLTLAAVVGVGVYLWRKR